VKCVGDLSSWVFFKNKMSLLSHFQELSEIRNEKKRVKSQSFWNLFGNIQNVAVFRNVGE
jgi:hypothetical protein